jgi:hypothetical protein
MFGVIYFFGMQWPPYFGKSYLGHPLTKLSHLNDGNMSSDIKKNTQQKGKKKVPDGWTQV